MPRGGETLASVEVNTAERLGVHEGSEYIRMKLMPSGP